MGDEALVHSWVMNLPACHCSGVGVGVGGQPVLCMFKSHFFLSCRQWHMHEIHFLLIDHKALETKISGTRKGTSNEQVLLKLSS